MGRGSSITYGKIQIISDGESLSTLVETLEQILKKYSYPEAKKDNEVPDSDAPFAVKDSKELENMKAIKDLLKKAKPADDSIINLVEDQEDGIVLNEGAFEEEVPDDKA